MSLSEVQCAVGRSLTRKYSLTELFYNVRRMLDYRIGPNFIGVMKLEVIEVQWLKARDSILGISHVKSFSPECF